MKFAEVAENVKKLVANPPSQETFIYELLLAYGSPKATVARLKSGALNLAKEPGEVLLKKKVWFKAVEPNVGQASSLSSPREPGDGRQAGCLSYIDEMKSAKATKTNDPRFLIVTDFEQILAVDRKTGDTLDIDIQSLETNVDFFLPWAGMEKTKLSNENPADIKAAEKMAKLFDVIRQDNPDYLREDEKRDERLHAMNVFLSRLLFCLFAEDTGIFEENAVCNAIASHTADDGSDLDVFFKQLFDWLDTPPNDRNLTTEYTEDTENKNGLTTEGAEAQRVNKPLTSSVSSRSEAQIISKGNNEQSEWFTAAGGENSIPQSIRDLPYVNGGLFKDHFDIPSFSARARRMIIEAGTLNWSEINPDIFGSMFQAVIDPEERHNLGQHYTSVTNIMKVIEPLFLSDFKAELERALERKSGKKQALHRLLDRIANVRIFDPACGSGNFLIIAYKELRKLEMTVFQELDKIEPQMTLSRMTVSQFYGIEIDDFAHETAILALWLAEHQMNIESRKLLGRAPVSLPLKEGANIACGNATRIGWETVCPKPAKPGSKDDEIYILGNPPYLGARMQSKEHKADMAAVFGNMKGANSLDYIACWFSKAAEYIRGTKIQFAFVSTNSVCQGEQVALLWPHILKDNLEIGFAHRSFKWSNNAKGSAAVICVVVGVRNPSKSPKKLFHGMHVASVENINAYLVAAGNVTVLSRRNALSSIPAISFGSMANDGGGLVLNETDCELLMNANPLNGTYIRKFLGSSEFIRGTKRWCLWISEENQDLALQDEFIRNRISIVKKHRESSSREATRRLAGVSFRFGEVRYKETQAIIVPSVSSERREYIPTGFLDEDTVISNLAFSIADAEPWLFGLISSQMHMAWVRAVAGRLKTDYRYSAGLCYNTFPIPDLTEGQKQTITMHVGEVLTEREAHSGKTMAQLYDPDKMPDGLRTAHHNLDLAVDRLYRSKPFSSDEERLEHLFKLYEEMVAMEQLV